MDVRELVTTLSFNLKDEKLKEFEKRIDDAKKKITGFRDALVAVAGTVTAAGTGLLALAVNTAKNIKSTEVLANQVGIAAGTLQELELVAQNAGLKVGELSNSFNVFSKVLGTASLSDKTNDFERLGIRLTDNSGKLKDTLTLYQEAATKINSLGDSSRKAALSQRLFGTSSGEVARIMGQSTEELNKQINEIREYAYIVDNKAIKTNREFLKSWSEFKTIIEGVKSELAISFMPIFTDLINRFKDWYKQNRAIVSQKLNSFVSGLSKAFEILFNVINLIITPVAKLIDLFGGFSNAVTILGSAFAFALIPRLLKAIGAFRALAVALLANPFGLLVIALTAVGFAVGLVIDDFWHWTQENDSVLGRLFGSWQDAKVKLKAIWESIYETFTDVMGKIGDFGQFIFDSIVDKVTERFDKILNLVRKIKQATIFRDEDLVDSGKDIRITRENVKKISLKQVPNEAISQLSPPISPTNNNVVNRGNNISNNVVQNISENITITVPAGTTEEQVRYISSQIADEIQTQFDYNISRGLDSLATR